MVSKLLNIAGATLAFALLGSSAFADAIDGDWCHKDGRRLSIRGPQIVTPGGKQMEGDYSRHWFNYVVPAPEPGTGQMVYLQLLDENTVQFRLGSSDSATPETWIRCSPTTSSLRGRPFG